MSAVYVVELDGPARAHLRRALEAHRVWCRSNGHRLPPELDALAGSIAVTNGPRRPSVDVTPVAQDGAGVALTLPEAAGRLRVSDRTVRRLVASGRLASVVVAGRRRIRPAALDAFLDSLEATPCP